MVQSINHKVELTMNGTSFLSGGTYGKLLLGDEGFEFYNDRKVDDFIQIPWNEISRVIVSFVFFKRYIPRFAIETKRNGTYSFAAKDPRHVLRVMRDHIGADKLLQSLGVFQIIKRALTKKKKNTAK